MTTQENKRALAQTFSWKPTRRTALKATGLGVLTLPVLAACSPSTTLGTQLTAAGEEHTNDSADHDINEALDALEVEHGITISLAVWDHASEKLFLHKGNEWTYEASIVKVPISLTLLRKTAFEQRPLTEDEKNLIEASITYSDNPSTSEIFRRIGSYDATDVAASSASINKTYELLGLANTQMGDTWGNNQAWAEDQLAIMRSIVDTVEWVNVSDAQFLLEKMIPLDWSQTWGIGSLHHAAPEGEEIFDISVKNGWIQDETGAWHINSVGVVRTDQVTYSIALLTKGHQDQQSGFDVASQAIQAYFNHKG
ncbi:hypothetical protein [Rothia nasimurium]|uniref:hypothetical protein n=1 Tax=Rothia nasimurium TaxID=85336 RepID=UPI003BA14E87